MVPQLRVLLPQSCGLLLRVVVIQCSILCWGLRYACHSAAEILKPYSRHESQSGPARDLFWNWRSKLKFLRFSIIKVAEQMAPGLPHLSQELHIAHDLVLGSELLGVAGHGRYRRRVATASCASRVGLRCFGPSGFFLSISSSSSMLMAWSSVSGFSLPSLSFSSNASKNDWPGKWKSGMSIPNFPLNLFIRDSQSAGSWVTGSPCARVTASTFAFVSDCSRSSFHAAEIFAACSSSEKVLNSTPS